MAIGGPKRVALAIFIPTGITGHHFQHQVAQGIDQLDVGIGLKALWVILLGTSGGNIELLQLFRDAIMKQQCPSMPLHQSATSPSISSCSTPARVARRDRKSTRLNSSPSCASRIPSSAYKKKPLHP